MAAINNITPIIRFFIQQKHYDPNLFQNIFEYVPEAVPTTLLRVLDVKEPRQKVIAQSLLKTYQEQIKLALCSGEEQDYSSVNKSIHLINPEYAMQSFSSEQIGHILEKAATWGHHRIAGTALIVLKNGDIPAAQSISILKRAVENRHAEVVKVLIDLLRGIPAVALGSMLKNAAENGYAEVVKVLIDLPRDVLTADVRNLALAQAAENGYAEVVKILVNSGLEISEGTLRYALDQANGKGYGNIVDILNSRQKSGCVLL